MHTTMENKYDMSSLHCYSLTSTTSDTVASLKHLQRSPPPPQQQQQQQSYTSTPIPLKRTRAKRSCDFCRQRKSRCDADTCTPCTNCKAWGYNCEFQTVRKKRGPPSV
ncbi:hypothetical protein BC941DRAFT_211370 [Chlamydoabsidia padenii]|nr:hypothetical protein BC941DRAFT_211370 [Chlamydoabsidia padenii]